MGFERTLSVVSPILLTANGGTQGQVQLATTLGLFVKQIVNLQGSITPALTVEIKRVLSDTQILVGHPTRDINHRIDVSAYTVADGAFLYAAEQPKAVLPMESRLYASYIQEPSNSWRVTPVDSFGNSINSTNPLPVSIDGTIAVGQVEVKGINGNIIEPNTDGSINVNIVSTPVAGNTVVNQYNEANSVPSGATAVLVQYTLSMSKTSGVLQRISVSGENIAKFTVFFNSIQIDTRRTFYGSSLSEYFEFTTGGSDGVVLVPGDTIVVKVVHDRPYVGDFEGRIQVLEIT